MQNCSKIFLNPHFPKFILNSEIQQIFERFHISQNGEQDAYHLPSLLIVRTNALGVLLFRF
jgi:hypothetical protein